MFNSQFNTLVFRYRTLAQSTRRFSVLILDLYQ